MKLRLLCVGRLSEGYLQDGTEIFAERIRHYLPLEIIELREEKAGRKADSRYLVAREGERLLEKLPPDALVVALDEKGRQLTSEKLARLIERPMVEGASNLIFIIGGPYGLSEDVKRRADRILSLSDLTFTHQMARLFLLEQIYRGLTIIRNEPYHNR